MSKKITHEEYCKRVYNLVGMEYVVLSTYEGMTKKIRMRHNIESCMNEWDVNSHSFLNGCRCPKCATKKRTKTDDEFRKEVDLLTNGEYIVCSAYINATTKVKFLHTKCNSEFFKTPNSFLGGRRCPKCAGNMKLNTEQYKKKIAELFGTEYQILGEYINCKTGILTKHKCGHEWEASPQRMFDKSTKCHCPICNNKKNNQYNFKQRFQNVLGEDYVLLSAYVKANKHVLVFHRPCGTKYKATPMNILKGSGCPECNTSIGERTIIKYLKENNIIYKSQFTFEDCKYRETLPFDFAIFDYEGNLKFLIEYHGGQHYFPVDYFGGVKGFKKQQKRDNIKVDYCNKNNIILLTIPYWDFENIELILNDYIKKHL